MYGPGSSCQGVWTWSRLQAIIPYYLFREKGWLSVNAPSLGRLASPLTSEEGGRTEKQNDNQYH
eukprot:1030331-Amphidinium_carterae.1